MGRRANRKKPVADINVVPYIDVMLVLLVIFMITAPMLTPGVEVQLPTLGETTLSQEDPPIIVSINKDGEYFIELGDDKPKAMAASKVGEYVKGIFDTAKVPVLIRADEAVSYGAVIKLMGSLRDAGVPDVGLVTEAP
jgi:biopolymer transport protein TolR